jgi:hypothetical protein
MNSHLASMPPGPLAASPITVKGRTFRVDTTRLEDPPDHFDADFAWAQLRHGAISLCFAKAKLGSAESFEIRLEVRLATDGMGASAVASLRKIGPSIERWVTRNAGLRYARPGGDLAQLPSEEDASLWADILRVTQYGNEAQIDAYQISLQQIGNATTGAAKVSRFDIAPIVRIYMTAFELHNLISDVAKVTKAIEQLRRGNSA